MSGPASRSPRRRKDDQTGATSSCRRSRTGSPWRSPSLRPPPSVHEVRRDLEALDGDPLDGVYLYGAYARGTAIQGSDKDLLVVRDGPVRPGREIRRMNPGVADVCLERDVLISVLPGSW